ncbi:MAG TPA: citramalate synthase [Solibacterales bacterium]|nr:citramalate synthase [Bryobacterales bacterium]
MRITTLDTTLREGVQGELVTFDVEQKLAIARRLDELGMDVIEGGWPAASRLDAEFFRRAAQALTLRHARLAAFGPVRSVHRSAEEDPQTQALLAAGTPVVCLFANLCEMRYSERGLRERIRDSVAFFRKAGREVIFDAAHFFDSFDEDEKLALEALETAQQAGAQTLVLCDSLGGALTTRLAFVCASVRCRFEGPLGIHAHNDAGLAVANTIAAVEEGFSHVQGSINGYGERCGVADLTTVLPNLELKLHHHTIGRDGLAELSGIARFVAMTGGLGVRPDAPYVGRAAFAHKSSDAMTEVAGVFAPEAHILPSTVGNEARELLSVLSGTGDVLRMIDDTGLASDLSREQRRELADRIRQLEFEGYDLEAAPGSFELLLREAAEPGLSLFDVSNYEVNTQGIGGFEERTRASVALEVNEAVMSATAMGEGPVHALDRALRECLAPMYPQLLAVQLVNYSTRVLNPTRGSAARVRVLIEWSTPEAQWATLGVSESLIGATWRALVDAMRLEILRLRRGQRVEVEAPDTSWAV